MSDSLQRLKILLIEDNPGDARLIEEMLADSQGALFELTNVVRLTTGLARLATEQFDVCLLDLTLPDSEGLDTFIKLYAKAPYLPIVVLSGFNDDFIAAQTMREGAQDYLVKGHVDGQLLIRSLYYAMERQRLLEELAESEPLSPISSLKQLPHYQYYVALSQNDKPQAKAEAQKELICAYQQIISNYSEAIEKREPCPSEQLEYFAAQLAANQTSAQQLMQIHLACLSQLSEQRPASHILLHDTQLVLVELLCKMMELYRA